MAASRALFTLCLVIGGIYLIGLVFLVWLKISSWFWFIYQLIFLLSIVIVFWVAPVLGVVLMCWALVGRQWLRHSQRALIGAARGLVGIAADALLYYAIVASITWQGSAAFSG